MIIAAMKRLQKSRGYFQNDVVVFVREKSFEQFVSEKFQGKDILPRKIDAATYIYTKSIHTSSLLYFTQMIQFSSCKI